MGQKIKIVVMEILDHTRPGNATWYCFELPEIFKSAPELFELQGHRVLEFDKKEGEALLEEAKAALQLQLKLRAMYHDL